MPLLKLMDMTGEQANGIITALVKVSACRPAGTVTFTCIGDT